MKTEVDVLVVGAGPTGLTLASELLRHGLSTRLVDAADAPSSWSRAIAVHARTLEILEQVGCSDALLDRGKRLHGATFWSSGSVIARIDFNELDTAYPFVLSISQAETESALRDVLHARNGRVEYGVRLVDLRQDGTGVSATLACGEVTECVRAAWLVGCDGAHSVVRKRLDLPFEGGTYEDRFMLADVKIAWDTRDDRVSTWLADDGIVACFPLPDARWRLVMTATEGAAQAPTLEELQALFDRRSRTSATLSDLVWSSTFRIHCRQVAHYRDDRVFLAGDAAHIHSPAGGQGMNTGIQDAHNLAWKLAHVHKGLARDRLLGSYHQERHAVGQSVLRSTDVATRVAVHRNAVVRGARDELARFLTSFEVLQQRVAHEVAELTVHYERSTLSAEHTTSMLQGRIGSIASDESPTVTSARAFAAACAAGRRARNGRITRAGESGTRTLFETLDTRRWNVLLFDGRSARPEGYHHLASIAATLNTRFTNAVDVSIVTPATTRPTALPDGLLVLLDPDGELEGAYGASSECVYVLRPDLYVGFRAQPVSEDQLVAWLRTFVR